MKGSKEETESSRVRTAVFVFLAGVIIALPLMIYWVSPYFSIEFLDLLTVFDIITSLLLSLALFYVYISLRDIQRTQATVQENQESLMRLGKTPYVNITSWNVENNTLHFTLANLGDGVAANISADIRILPQNLDYSEDFESYPKRIYQEGQNTRKSFLNGKETAEFVGPATATTVVKNVQDWEFTRVVNHLCSEGEEKIEFIIKIEYRDLFGEKTSLDVTSRTTEIQNGMTFEEALADSESTNTVSRHTPNDSELDQFSALDSRGIFFDPR